MYYIIYICNIIHVLCIIYYVYLYNTWIIDSTLTGLLQRRRKNEQQNDCSKGERATHHVSVILAAFQRSINRLHIVPILAGEILRESRRIPVSDNKCMHISCIIAEFQQKIGVKCTFFEGFRVQSQQ